MSLDGNLVCFCLVYTLLSQKRGCRLSDLPVSIDWHMVFCIFGLYQTNSKYICVYGHAYMCVCICVFMRVCVCVCVYMYLCKHVGMNIPKIMLEFVFVLMIV